MRRITRRSLSCSCILGAIIGAIACWHYQVPPVYYIVMWFFMVIGVSFYEPRSSTVDRFRKFFGIKHKYSHKRHYTG